MKVNYLLKMIFALVLGVFGLTNANAQFLENTATVDVVRISTWMDTNGMNGYAMADIDGVVTIVEDNGQDSVQWYQIPAGEFEGMQAYYYKNVATDAYLIPGEQVEDGGDWKVLHAVTSATKSDDARWIPIETSRKWNGNSARYLASVQGFVSAEVNGELFTEVKPFVAAGFFTMQEGNASNQWGVQGPAVSVNSPGPDAGNAWCAIQLFVAESGVANPDYQGESGNDGCLDLTALTLGNEFYTAATKTITYTAAWQYAGWEWAGGTDFSEFNYLDVTLNTSGLPAGTEIEFCVSYVGGYSGDGDWISKLQVKDGMQTVRIPIGKGNRGPDPANPAGAAFVTEYEADASKVWRIGTKNNSATGGTVVLESLCLGYEAPTPPPAETCLDLENLTLLESPTTYDAETKTITYTTAWKYGGWEWTAGQDYSEFTQLEVTLSTEGLTNAGDIEFCVAYVGGDGAGDYIKKLNVEEGMQTFTIPLGVGNREGSAFVDEYPLDASKVWRIGVKTSGTGTVVLENLCFNDDIIIPEGCLDVNNVNFFSNPSNTYDPETQTATYTAGWTQIGWEWAEPQDFSQYQKVRFEFDASGLPLDGEGPQGTKVQLIVMYDGGRSDGDEEVEVRSNVTEGEVMLGVKGDASKVKKIAIKTEQPGTVIFRSVCLLAAEDEPVDLTIDAIRWEPENPAPGDSITFFASIINNSEIASPAKKHGVVWQVNGQQASWCDGFFGPIAAGDTIEVSSRMEGSTGPLWEAGNDFLYSIRAQINDQRDVNETDYENNYSTPDSMYMEGNVDLSIFRLSWTYNSDGEEPAVGDEVVFNATIINTGSLNSPKGLKHGVAFKVDGNLVSWSDTYFEAIPSNPDPNKATRVQLEANNGPAGVNYWVVAGTAGVAAISAEVNDQNDIPESDKTNNTFERELTYTTVGIEFVAGEESYVYAEDGILYIVGYPVDSKVEIFNLMGQKVSDVNGESIQLNTGTYIVKITEKGKGSIQKVLIK